MDKQNEYIKPKQSNDIAVTNAINNYIGIIIKFLQSTQQITDNNETLEKLKALQPIENTLSHEDIIKLITSKTLDEIISYVKSQKSQSGGKKTKKSKKTKKTKKSKKSKKTKKTKKNSKN